MTDNGPTPDGTLRDANGVPFRPIRALLGELEVVIPPATVARALYEAQHAAEAPTSGLGGAEALMRRVGPLANGLARMMTGVVLGLAYSMFGRYAPDAQPPQPPPNGSDPTSYALAYLASLGLHALAARRWRLDYDEREDGSIVITRLGPDMAPADAAPDRSAPPRLGPPARDAGQSDGDPDAAQRGD